MSTNSTGPSFPRRRESSTSKDSRPVGNNSSGFPVKKSLGQHWLFDESSLEAMITAGEIQPSDVVVEVGPGLGPLTKKLCEVAKKVIAVELDDVLAVNLHKNVFGTSSKVQTLTPGHPELVSGSNGESNQILKPRRILNEAQQVQDDKAPNLEVVNQSILDFDTSNLPKNYKVIANIPYYLTSNLIRRMLENPNPPSVMVLLIQKEVAQRVAAEPGSMGILSVATQFYAEVSLKVLVPAELFTPPPKVDSQIVQIKLRKEPLFSGVNTEVFFKLVRAGFSEKRKKLRSALSGGLQISKPEADVLIESASISLSARAQELTLSQWNDLYQAYIR